MIRIRKYILTIVTDDSEWGDFFGDDCKEFSVGGDIGSKQIEHAVGKAFPRDNKPTLIEAELLEDDSYTRDMEHCNDKPDDDHDWWDIYDVDGTDRGFHRRRWEDGSDSTFDYPPDDYNTDY